MTALLYFVVILGLLSLVTVFGFMLQLASLEFDGPEMGYSYQDNPGAFE